MISIKSVKRYCKEYTKIENYEEAVNSPEKWECHHRNEEYYSQAELKELGLYYSCPPCELIFLTREEHRKLDSFCKRCGKVRKGKVHSEEAKQKISESLKGKHYSADTKQKMSESRKGHKVLEETKQKISKSMKGKHHSEEAKQKMSEAMKARREAYKKSGRKDWNVFQKEWKEKK